jgi:hypothetical protein
MLTREQQIERALEILEPPPDKRAICQQNIEFCLDDMETFRGGNASLKQIRSKASARAWLSYNRALKRLRSAHDALVAEGWEEPPIAIEDMERAIEASERYRDGENFVRFAAREEACAVDRAHELLRQWRPKERVTTTKGGKWWSLSAILFGQPADLYRHLRACDRRPLFD